MNLSHVVHEFSFGPYFPAIAQPLDSSVEITERHFTVFQYFVSVVPTIFVDARNRMLRTNQYSVTDYTRQIEHGQGVPGIFIKYDIEPLLMTIRERSVSLVQFLVRVAGVLGGVWVCVGYALRVTDRIGRVVTNSSSDQTPEAYASSFNYRRPGTIGGLTVDRRSSPSRWGVDAVKETWSNLSSPTKGHRKIDSVQQRIFSEEGRAW